MVLHFRRRHGDIKILRFSAVPQKVQVQFQPNLVYIQHLYHMYTKCTVILELFSSVVEVLCTYVLSLPRCVHFIGDKISCILYSLARVV